ncbi:hypothetical protein CSB11_02355 [Candidatus Campbellbacteria bacterium]|nr:MAG: hypothetical protein CSB11_02355 [Candidatus Campbellbacteria bacterium]
MEEKKSIYVNITFGTVVKTSLFFILLYVIFYLKELVLIFLTAVVIASVIEPFIISLQRIKVPRVVSVIFVYLLLISIILGLSVIYMPIILDQLNNILKALPGHIDSLNAYLIEATKNSELLSRLAGEFKNQVANFDILGLTESVKKIDDTHVQNWGGLLISMFGGIFNFMLIIILSFYLALQEHSIDKFLRIVTHAKYTKYAINLWKRSQRKISLWMQGQLLISLLVGSITYLGLKYIFGFEQAALLGLIAAFSELIPFLGPYIAAFPAVAIALLVGGWPLAIPVILFYLIIQIIESQFVYPLVVKKIVGIPSLLVLMSLIIGGQLFGFLGVILSIPIAAAFMEYIKDVDKRQKEALKQGEIEEVDLSKKVEGKKRRRRKVK